MGRSSVSSIPIVISAIADVATAISLIFAIYTYKKDAEKRRAEEHRKAKQDTIEAYKDLNNTTFSKLNAWKPADIKAAAEDRTSPAYKELGTYLADIERFCVGITEDIYDFDTFYKLSHGYFDSDWGLKKRLMPLLEKKLDRAGEDYYENLHKVWKMMEERGQ